MLKIGQKVTHKEKYKVGVIDRIEGDYAFVIMENSPVKMIRLSQLISIKDLKAKNKKIAKEEEKQLKKAEKARQKRLDNKAKEIEEAEKVEEIEKDEDVKNEDKKLDVEDKSKK